MKGTVEQAFIAAYEQHSDELFRFCFYRVYNRELARDLLQETFTRVWRYLADGGDIQNFRAFLYQTARNLIIDNSRRHKEQSLDQLQEEQGFQPAVNDQARLEANIELSRLSEIIKQLDPPYQEAVMLRYASGLKPKEIAEITGESVNVISVRIHRGAKQLRKLMQR